MITLFFAAIISLLLTYPLVRILQYFNCRQTIREEGPQSHRQKAGTPTMGGIGFILTIVIMSVVLLNIEYELKSLALILLMFGFAVIGFLDDWLKISRQHNLGLTFWQKIIAQTFVAALFTGALIFTGQIAVFNPTLYFLFALFIIVGSANATNLTDGLNGLLAGTGGIAFLAFAFLARKLLQFDLATFSFAAAGAVLVFIVYNYPKAQVFMGDVGSLAIGAALAGIAIILHQELRLALIGGVFVIETLSVILQVTIYKLLKKRIFRMSPLHHHFELLGIKEVWVVVGFWVVGVVLGIIGLVM